jgi:uncharacterized protein
VIINGALRRRCSAVLLSIAVLSVLALGSAHSQVPVPALVGHVTDQTGTLTQQQKSSLEKTLSAFEARKGTQLAILLVPTTAPEAIEPYALRVAEQWKLGRKKVDDGVILVVAKDDRTVRIEVGYGLEGALSDIVSKRIISETIVPRFQQGDFYAGLQSGTDQIMGVIDGEPLPAVQGSSKAADQGLQQFVPLLFIVALALGSVLRRVFGKVGGSLITGIAVTGLAWFVIGTLLYAVLAGLASMVVTLMGAGTVLRGVGGLYGGGRGGSGGGGGFGGGGFRGGGGGFGGGGASGRW